MSVVLFATLLSLNFTSCIDDGVSDAVDQVYLAQAEFLKAQAALKEADAQKVLAEAAYEQARAAVETAKAAGIDAVTAHQLIINEGAVEANALQAQKNVIFLAEEQAKLEVALQTQMNLLQAAQSAYDVAMVNLGEAVAKAKDALIYGYYGDYAAVTDALEDLYEERIQAEHDLAVKELMMVTINGNVDMVARAYYQALLEADLAKLEGELVAEEANLAALQAITEADAGDPAKEITALEAQIAVLQEQKDALVIEHAEALNAKDQAHEAWLASTAKYNDLGQAETLLKQAIAAKKEHTDAIMDADDAIALANANIAATPAAEAAVMAVDTTTAFNGIAAAKQLIEDKEDLVDDAWDLVNDAEQAYDDAKAASDAASFYLVNSTVDVNAGNTGVGFGFYPRIVNAEIAFISMTNALAAPLLDVATATTNNDAAQQAEVDAQAAWAADPTGFTTTDTNGNHSDSYYGTEDFDLGEIGIDTDLSGDTYMRVATWIEYPAPGSGDYRPATFEPTKYNTADLGVAAAALIADGTNGIGGNADVWLWEDNIGAMALTDLDGNLKYGADEHFINAADAGQAALENIAVFVNVELDDDSDSNFDILMDARIAAENTEHQLGLATGEIDDLQGDLDDATALVTKAYAAYGFTFPDSNGITLLSDWQYIQDYRDGLIALTADAYEAWNNSGVVYQAYPGAAGYKASIGTSSLLGVYNAEKAVADAEAALGTDFRTGYTKNSFLNEFENWYNATPDPTPVVTAYASTTTYERFEGIVNADGDVENIDEVPHATPTAYQALRNAYFEMVWAMEAVDALQTVEYIRLYDNTGTAIAAPAAADYTNAKAIDYATADKAKLEALLPSHDYAIDYLQAEFDRLAALYNLDTTNWDLEGGHGLGQMLYDLPDYAVYLDAVEASNVVIAEIAGVNAQISDLENLIAAYAYLQSGDFVTDGTNVADFMDDIADDIETSMNDIVDLKEDIEIQKGLVATGIVNKATAEAWVAEYQRRLALLNTKIDGFESAADSLLARINALLN